MPSLIMRPAAHCGSGAYNYMRSSPFAPFSGRPSLKLIVVMGMIFLAVVAVVVVKFNPLQKPLPASVDEEAAREANLAASLVRRDKDAANAADESDRKFKDRLIGFEREDMVNMRAVNRTAIWRLSAEMKTLPAGAAMDAVKAKIQRLEQEIGEADLKLQQMETK